MARAPALAIVITLTALAASSTPTARAAVSAATASGFLSTHEVVVPDTPLAAYEAFVRVGDWWSPAHTYSGDARALTLAPRAGGCFCEQWNANSVEHARVVQAIAGDTLRLTGGLGPLQALSVQGVLTVTFRRIEDGQTRVSLSYRVAGPVDATLETLASPVDRVLGEQLSGFAAARARRAGVQP